MGIPATRLIARTSLLTLSFTAAAYANHGPGASGGGSQTISGETLKTGHFELSLREDYAQFQRFDANAAADRARTGGDFDALRRGFLTTVDGAYGVTNDFQVGATIGYFFGNDFLSADRNDDGDIESGTVNPQGLTDLTLTAKYRVLKGWTGNLSLVAGVTIPIGRSDIRLSNAERLAPTDQPGTGRWAIPFGVAYSRFITSHLTLDASLLYTTRFERDEFDVGDRFDAGLALAYRITDSVQSFPQFSVFGELNNVYLFKDRAGGELDENTGSETLYFTPGARVRFNPQAALTLAPSFPIYQHVNGDQGDVEFKLALTLSFSF